MDRTINNTLLKQESTLPVIISSPPKLSSPLTAVWCSAFYEFTRRLTPDQLISTKDRWEILPIENLASTLIAELHGNAPYTSDIFTHADIEFIALYAARPEQEASNRLTIKELSNVLVYKTACNIFGKSDVSVHFMKQESCEIDQSSLTAFHTTVNNLPNYPTWQSKIVDHFKSSTIPRHQLVYFTAPKDSEKDNASIPQAAHLALNAMVYIDIDGKIRRYIPTVEMTDHFNSLLYPDNPSSALPALGDFEERDFELFTKRPVATPFSLTPFPVITDGSTTGNWINYYIHDLTFHCFVDKANPHLLALKELYPLIRQMPQAGVESTYNLPFPPYVVNRSPLIESYLDREYNVNIQFHNLAPDTRFWLSMEHLFKQYSRSLMQNEHIEKMKLTDPSTKVMSHYDPNDAEKAQKLLRFAAKMIIRHIEANENRWKKEYNITLDSLKLLIEKSQDSNGTWVPNLSYESKSLVSIFQEARKG